MSSRPADGVAEIDDKLNVQRWEVATPPG